MDGQTPGEYDIVVVGCGNGACGFLANYLPKAPPTARVLVTEEGEDYFDTCQDNHQNRWTKSYSVRKIFQLHNARTLDGKPILSGRACTLGGGGSINYAMIHESSKWLAKTLGHTEEYWDTLKTALNKRFDRPDPASHETPVTKHILEVAVQAGFLPPDAKHQHENIPSYQDQDVNQLYHFSTQFDVFGQRTHSGVSLVDWHDPRITLLTHTKVTAFHFDASNRCTGIRTACSLAKKSSIQDFDLSACGKVIMCAGAASPRLLMPYRDQLQNHAIGKSVNDHILLPLGLYVLPKDKKLKVLPRDIYGPVFATTVIKATSPDEDDVVVGIDFFTGPLQKMLYMVSPFFLSFLPNFIKSPMLRRPWLFHIIKNFFRMLVTICNIFVPANKEFGTALIKFCAAKPGQYDDDSRFNRITLGWFDGPRDAQVAETAIAEVALPLLDQLGTQPSLPLRMFHGLITKIAYRPSQVHKYVNRYRNRFLLSQQHMAGGLLFGDAIETGWAGDQEKAEAGDDVVADRSKTALLKGSTNVHVADLSTMPLPRVSPQMTAYLVGYHVAEQLWQQEHV